ncbi:acyltransferase family protein [Streptacidiphilus fuscans]|uniref:Acyltransferase n=1 Tax=Streptacidiphilus fuscans TaxID=2789292 RepID=A0A931AY11_9ACTN|nr:acyltransferase [Streptacidiphilus fuscans]MBF9067514.1 acyltransferase [Streptacidiphilus fuscans]
MSRPSIDHRGIDHRAPLPSLTGLRFVAAAPVFFFHLSLTFVAMNPFRDPSWAHAYQTIFWKAGWVGVSFFFVLSGFLLMWRNSDSRGYLHFLRKRVVKLFPSHVVTWSLVMILFAGAAATTPWEYLPNLFLVNSWFPAQNVYLAVNVPSWSLCCELMFYVLFPLLAPLVRRIPKERLGLVLAGCIAGTFLVAAITTMLPNTPHTDGMPISSIQFWVGYNFPLPRLLEFTSGMVLARLLAAGRLPKVRPALAWGTLLVGYVVAELVPFAFSFIPFTLVPLLLVVASAVRRDLDGRRTWLSSRTMVWLGEVSFGFYMTQYVVMYSLRITIQHGAHYAPLPGIAVVLGTFAATVLTGWLLYRLVEQPAMRRWATSRRRPERPEPARGTRRMSVVASAEGQPEQQSEQEPQEQPEGVAAGAGAPS